MRVALVATVLNESATIGSLLSSIDAQTRRPDEVVVVDGGSSDGTLETLHNWARARPGITVVQLPGANIAAGRNHAISRTSADAIAVTDGGCVLDGDWLDRLSTTLEGADVAMGYYVPLATRPFERLSTSLTVPDAGEIDPARFMPSSRSVAFRRGVWERAGGYPEWLAVGEDMYFDFRVLDAKASRVFVPDAIVRWRPRPALGSFLRQYYGYARGDGIAGMYPRRHAARFAAYAVGVFLLVAAVAWPPILVVPVLAGAGWLAPAFRRAWRRLPRGRLAALLVIPVLAVLMDGAKMLGYIAGRIVRVTRRRP